MRYRQMQCIEIDSSLRCVDPVQLITRQFIPITGTFIYNAMSSTSSVLTL